MKSEPRSNADTPPPGGSVLTYGVVGSVSAILLLAAVAGFYELDLTRHVVPVAGMMALAAAGGIALHVARTQRHLAALVTK